MTMHKGRAGYRRFREMNSPPAGEAFLWLTKTMLESPAWRALTYPARKVVERLAIEHMNHAATENGQLVCTYDDFERMPIARKGINNAITIAEALGWIDVVERGQKGFGVARRPSIYSLTWLPRCDGSPPTNRWKAVKTDEEASLMVAKALDRKLPKLVLKQRAGEARPTERRSEPARENGRLPAKILKVVDTGPLEKTQQNRSLQWTEVHQTSGLFTTHSSGPPTTGEKSGSRLG